MILGLGVITRPFETIYYQIFWSRSTKKRIGYCSEHIHDLLIWIQTCHFLSSLNFFLSHACVWWRISSPACRIKMKSSYKIIHACYQFCQNRTLILEDRNLISDARFEIHVRHASCNIIMYICEITMLKYRRRIEMQGIAIFLLNLPSYWS